MILLVYEDPYSSSGLRTGPMPSSLITSGSRRNGCEVVAARVIGLFSKHAEGGPVTAVPILNE